MDGYRHNINRSAWLWFAIVSNFPEVTWKIIQALNRLKYKIIGKLFYKKELKILIFLL